MILRSCYWWSVLSLAISQTSSYVLTKQDEDFLSLPSKLSFDHSGRAGDPPQKYFHESTFHCHYDGRFADAPVRDEDRLPILSMLIQSYLVTMQDIGVETWLVHGTLLGWYWNQKILPWDTDIDVQVDEASITFLAKYYNMTMHHFKVDDDDEEAEGREYMLEINPNYNNRSRADKLNVIDARWVDVSSGLFIDVTAVSKNLTAPEPGVLSCKDNHDFYERDMFPLRDSTFEGVPVKVPYDYKWVLEEEYTKYALTRTYYSNHRWNETSFQWEPIRRMIPKVIPPAPRLNRTTKHQVA